MIEDFLLVALVLKAASTTASAQCLRSRPGYGNQTLCPSGGRRLGNKAPSSKLQMYIRPSWDMWEKLNFADGFAEGVFATEQLWSTNVEDYFSASDAADIIRISNFAAGTTGYVSQPIIEVETESLYEVRRQFEGSFKQRFNAKCYPYDHQEVSFQIEIDKPVSNYWDLYLLCGSGWTAKDSEGNVVGVTSLWQTGIYSCTQTIDSVAVGMTWDDLVCTRESSSSITCKMNGGRSNDRIIINFLLPSIMVTMTSFGSFLLHVSLAMPRIGTTMIAMLTLVNLRNALAQSLPGSGDLSWIEKYFMVATICMFLNLCCHVASISLHKRGFPLLSDFVDEFGCGVSFCLSIILPFLLLATSGCADEGVAPTIATVLGFLLLLFVIWRALYARWDAIKAWWSNDAVVSAKQAFPDGENCP